MSVNVRQISDPERWNDLQELAPEATPFHRFEALREMARHSGGELTPFAGFYEGDPVGLFPVFERRYGPVRTAFSPPPDLKVSYLGPALLDPGRRSQVERLRTRFVDAVEERLRERGVAYAHVRSTPAYDDPRPFVWNGYEARPRFTYVVDLDQSEEDLFRSFSGDLRENIRDGRDRDVAVERGGVDAIDPIFDRLHARHEEQGIRFPVSAEFARDLYRALPDGTMRTYVCRSDGRAVGGQITLEDDRHVYAWQGVGDHDADVAVNDHLDWHVMREAMDRGVPRYDLVGANNQRLCNYKAKFAPDVREYFALERSSTLLDMLKRGYRWVDARRE